MWYRLQIKWQQSRSTPNPLSSVVTPLERRKYYWSPGLINCHVSFNDNIYCIFSFYCKLIQGTGENLAVFNSCTSLFIGWIVVWRFKTPPLLVSTHSEAVPGGGRVGKPGCYLWVGACQGNKGSEAPITCLVTELLNQQFMPISIQN